MLSLPGDKRISTSLSVFVLPIFKRISGTLSVLFLTEVKEHIFVVFGKSLKNLRGTFCVVFHRS